MKTGILCFILKVICIAPLFAQSNSLQPLELKNLSEFKEQAGNWFVVGDVSIDPSVDVSHKQEAPPAPKKKNKKEAASAAPRAVNYQEGSGILLNINDETKKSNIVTNWEHGDIYLEMDVMLPKGSNSGLYLQGKYELQLEDSWGVVSPKFSNMGGIYRNWENAPERSYMGKAPLSNAAKAPGLWQKLIVSFKAPQFDNVGKKTSNARLTAELNGVKIHDNIEIPLPTGGAMDNKEAAKGPLMIQGDHGPIAIRNIMYRHMRSSNVALADLQYSYFKGKFEDIDDFSHSKPTSTGSSKVLTYEVGQTDEQFGLQYKGNIEIPEDNSYTFRIAAGGGSARLILNSEQVAEAGGSWGNGTVDLKKGKYPVEIYYNRNMTWGSPRLGLFVESPGTYLKPLHTSTSFPLFEDATAPILVQPAQGPKLLRAFLDYKGDRSKRLTHTIGVGEPKGVHYIYDLKAGNLVCVWRGEFVDATPMWNSRGDGSFQPLGLVQYISPQPSLAILENESAAFPDQSNEKDFKGQGYELDEETGRPTFRYMYKGAEVEDKIYPEENNGMVSREVTVKNMNGNKGLHLKLAEGARIVMMEDGTYVVGDKEYYLKVDSARKPVLRKIGEGYELIMPIDDSQVKYSIIW
ncbi:MAG: DUF1080 domain-containing protein [Bacteroidota bacterium]|nr:DUF1080 domain-containing protein [Bacteroidota bacterium]